MFNKTDDPLSSDQALRIKTKASATGSTVSGITYSGNTATGIKRFGVIVDQVCSHRDLFLDSTRTNSRVF